MLICIEFYSVGRVGNQTNPYYTDYNHKWRNSAVFPILQPYYTILQIVPNYRRIAYRKATLACVELFLVLRT